MAKASNMNVNEQRTTNGEVEFFFLLFCNLSSSRSPNVLQRFFSSLFIKTLDQLQVSSVYNRKS